MSRIMRTCVWVFFGKAMGLNFRMKKVVMSKIKVCLPFMTPDIVCTFQMICLRGGNSHTSYL
jgi:hypothetical protein